MVFSVVLADDNDIHAALIPDSKDNTIVDYTDEKNFQEQVEEDINELRFGLLHKEEAIAQQQKKQDRKIKKKHAKKRKWKKIRSMSLKELDEKGHIKRLCKKYGLPKSWFDRVATTESCYGVYTPDGSYNAWGWGIYGKKVTKLEDNWYDSAEFWIKEFMGKYGPNPTIDDMLRYCPGGAYNKYFSKSDQARVEKQQKIKEKKEKAKEAKEKKKKAKKLKAKKQKQKEKKKADKKKTDKQESTDSGIKNKD